MSEIRWGNGYFSYYSIDWCEHRYGGCNGGYDGGNAADSIFQEGLIKDKEECIKFLKKMEETVKTYVDPTAHAKIIDRSFFFPKGDDHSFLEHISGKTTPTEFVDF